MTGWLPGLPEAPCACDVRNAARPEQVYAFSRVLSEPVEDHDEPRVQVALGGAGTAWLKPRQWEWRAIEVPDGA